MQGVATRIRAKRHEIMTDTDEPTKESLLDQCQAEDNGVAVAPKEPELDDPEPGTEEAKAAPKKEADAKAKEEIKEKDAESGSKDTEAKEAQKPEEKVKSKREQSEERKGKTWQEINAEKEVIKAEREALAKEREEVSRRAEAIQRSKASSEPIRDDHGATAKDYRAAAKDFLAKGDQAGADACEQLASNLDRKQKQLQEEQAKAQFAEGWTRTYKQQIAAEPDLVKKDSPLQLETARLLHENKFLLSQEDGLTHAVKLAKANLSLKEFEGTKAELAKLKEDNAKLQKKLSIDGGPPTGAPGEEASFDELSPKEQRKRLENAARSHDRAKGYADE